MSVNVELLFDWGALRPIDRVFAEAVVPPSFPLARCVVAMASRCLGDGHACVPLDVLAGRNFAPKGVPPAPLPGALEMREALLRANSDGALVCDVLGEPPLEASPAPEATARHVSPLVLDKHRRLYLRRYYEHEQLLARSLLSLSSDPGSIEHGLLDEFFPPESSDPHQRAAAKAALSGGLTVISGGPGTGKTSTVVKLLAVLGRQAWSRGQPFPRVALLAPTGKAAARLSESIRTAKERLGLSEDLVVAIPETASTIHRALGVRADNRTRFWHHEQSPLDVDVVIVDEASMIDLALMRHLLSAVRPGAHVVLLGDRNQLASVEAGSVLSELCDLLSESDGAIHGARRFVQLERSFRFSPESGIFSVAQAIRQGDTSRTLALLGAGRADLDFVALSSEAGEDLPLEFRRKVLGGYRSALAESSPEAALDELARFRVLCAHRRGPFGVETVNRCIQAWMQSEEWIEPKGEFYHGRLVMVTQNDPSVGLSNGDIGLVWASSQEFRGGLSVFFPRPDGAARELSPAELPAHETAFAMTIHKSQGSEYDDVVVLLPESESPLLSRELLYTAVTRAKARVTLFASEAVTAACVARRVERFSGLGDALR